MNVYKYLNSKDVAEYLERIGYEFTFLEAVRVIEHCNHINLKEKHGAFRLLMEEMPDEEITLPAECGREAKETTLHRLLKTYIKGEEDLLQGFALDDEGYLYEIQYVGFSGGIKRTFHHNYLTHKEMKKELENISNLSIPLDKITELCVNKINTETKDQTFLTMDEKGAPLNVINMDVLCEPYTVLRFEIDNNAIPHPFKKGDLVCSINNETPFVFLEAREENVVGYFLMHTGLKKYEIFASPFEMEYCRKELSGKEKALQSVSDFVKEKTTLDEFANRYHKVLLESFATAVND